MTKICIDGFNLALPHGTGIATYSRSLLGTITNGGATPQVLFNAGRNLTNNDTINESIIAECYRPLLTPKSIWGRWSLAKQTRNMSHSVRPTYIPRTDNVLWEHDTPCHDFWAAENLYSLSNRAFHRHGTVSQVEFTGPNRPTLMHWTMPTPITAKGIPNVVTVHDIIPIKLPYTTDTNRERYYNLVKSSTRTSDLIIAVSEASKRDLIDTFKINENRIEVTYQSIDHNDYKIFSDETKTSETIRSTFSLEWKDYFLYFGAFEPKKNIGRIIESYLSANTKSKLVLAGAPGWMSEADLILAKQFIADTNTDSERIRIYEYLPRNLLLNLIKGAKATLFPSLYEGFGLPVLESMTLGTPVLTSDRGSLPEVVGNAGLVVPANSIEAMTRGIRQLDNDTDWLTAASAMGQAQAREFSPENYRTRLSKAYAKVGVHLL